MASDKIEFKDLFGKDLLDKLEQFQKGFEKVLETQEKFLKQSKKENKTAEQIEKITVSVVKSKAAIEGLTEVEKQRLKIEKKLNDAKEKGAVENEKLNIQLQKQKKATKELANEELGLISVYAKQSKKLNNLRKEYKDLILSEGKATKATKKLKKEITNLDKELKDVDAAAGQFQRNVGNYPDALGKASKAILGTVAAVGSLKGAFDGVKASLENTAEGSDAVAEVTSGISAGWDQFTNVVASGVLDIQDWVEAVNENVAQGKGVIDSLKGQEENFVRTAEATDNFGEKLSDAVDGNVALTKATREWAKELRPLEEGIVSLNGQIAKQQIIAGDGTRSFNEINAAILKGQSLQIARAKINITVAAKEKSLIDEEIRLKNKAGGASIEQLDKQSEATIRLKEANGELRIELFENQKEIRQVQQDRLEKDLDILIDGFDNQKTINERKIADERATFEEKERLLNETKRLADESFLAQKEVLAQLSDAGINVDELLGLSATELQKEIRLLEQSEIIEGRTLEVVRERRTVLQDLVDIELELANIKKQALINTEQSQQNVEQENFDFKKDLLDRELNDVKTTAERKKAIEDEVYGTQIEQINDQAAFDEEIANREIKDLEELSAKLLEIQNKQSNDIERLRLDRLAKEEADELASLEKRKDAIFDFISEVSGATKEALDKRFNDVNKANADEIEEREENIDRQQQLAEKGLDNQIAFEEKKKAEAQLKEQEDLKKQQKIKEGIALAEAYLVAFQARLKDNPDTAGFKALSDVLLAKGIAQTLVAATAGFEEGGYTGEYGTSEVAGVVHGQEFVIDAATTKQMGLRGEDMSGFKNRMFSGQMFNHDFMTTDMSSKQAQRYDNTNVVNEIKQLREDFKSRPIQQVDVDRLGNLIETIHKNGVKTVIKYKGSNRI